MARSIGIMAEQADVLRLVTTLSSKLVPITDMRAGLSMVHREVSNTLGFDSGSTWLAERSERRSRKETPSVTLRPLEIRWFSERKNRRLLEELSLDMGDGLAGWIARHEEPLMLNNERQIREIPARHPAHRRNRKLRSFAGIPILSEGSQMGVLEFGSTKRRSFTQAEVKFINAAGIIAANFTKRTRERGVMVGMHAKRSKRSLLKYIESELPVLLGALAATVYLPVSKGHRRLLEPAFSESIIKGIGPGAESSRWSNSYDLSIGEGLTGWVGKYQACLRLKDCADTAEVDGLYKSGRLLDLKGDPIVVSPIWLGRTRAELEKFGDRETYPVVICAAVDESGTLRAVLRVCERRSAPFGPAAEEFVRQICGQLAICLAKISSREATAERKAKEEMGNRIVQYAHDFRRDIVVAKGYAKAAEEEAVNAKLSGASHIWTKWTIEGLIDKLDELVKSARAGKPMELRSRKRVDLNKCIREVAKVHEERCSRMGLKMVFDLRGCSKVNANLDPRSLRSNVDSVLANATESTQRARRPKGILTIRCQRSKDRRSICVSFADNGEGFDRETLARVNAGTPPKPEKRYGMGISLQGCKLFVERLGGSFSASNIRGKHGAVVEWVLPLEKISTKKGKGKR
jgi:signal transduction histidine kinase